MSEKEKVEIKDLIDSLKELDQKDMVILNNSVEVLKARRELDKVENAPA